MVIMLTKKDKIEILSLKDTIACLNNEIDELKNKLSKYEDRKGLVSIIRNQHKEINKLKSILEEIHDETEDYELEVLKKKQMKRKLEYINEITSDYSVDILNNEKQDIF